MINGGLGFHLVEPCTLHSKYGSRNTAVMKDFHTITGLTDVKKKRISHTWPYNYPYKGKLFTIHSDLEVLILLFSLLSVSVTKVLGC